MRIGEEPSSRLMEQETLQVEGRPSAESAPGAESASLRVDAVPVGELRRRAAAYQTILEALSRSTQPSLVDFLK